MIVGDWAKGDFAAANKKLGTRLWLPDGARQPGRLCDDGRCVRLPDEQQADQKAAQDKLAHADDGSGRADRSSTRSRVPCRRGWMPTSPNSMTARKLGQKVMAGGAANQLPNFALAFSPDTQGQIEDLLVQLLGQRRRRSRLTPRSSSPRSSATPATSRHAGGQPGGSPAALAAGLRRAAGERRLAATARAASPPSLCWRQRSW